MARRKRTRRQSVVRQKIPRKLKIEEDEPHVKEEVNLGALEE